MSAALVNRSLSTLKTELEFLRDSEVISEDFYNQIVSKLPDRYQSGAPPINFSNASTPIPTPTVSNEKLAPPPGPPPAQNTNQEYVEVLYDYQPQQPEDLELRVGDKVKLVERTSADWWKGINGPKTGMFPANYVKVLDLSEKRDPAAPPYTSVQQIQPQHFQQPQQFQPPQTQPQPQFQQYQQVMPQPLQQVQQQPQEGHHHNGIGRRFASKLGNAAIFGAGATIGSDIVNSIF